MICGRHADYVRSFAGVPKRGTQCVQIFAPQFSTIAPQYTGARQGIMDDTGQCGYRFSSASMTESCRVEVGPLPSLPEGGLGEGTKLRFVKSLKFRGWALLGATALCLALPGAITTLGNSAYAGGTLEERKQPMHFKWNACQPDCRGWVSAVGIVTSDSPREFEEFAKDRQLAGATIVLDSSGGSVNDSIALGRKFRGLGALTTVGATVRTQTAQGERASVRPEAYCESMGVFLLLSGKTRYVPPVAHVRVHQIWMGDRADDAKAASYTAQDLMIVERDIGRLAKFTFDMGGTGDLLSLALSVPPWEDLHEMSRGELQLTNLVTTDAVAEVLPQTPDSAAAAVAELPAKQMQDRFASETVSAEKPQIAAPKSSTKTAEVFVPTGAAAPVPAQ